MERFKEGSSSCGKLMHYTVGALIKRRGKYFLIDRNTEPFGFACVAGHVEKGEEPEQAIKREVSEESGLKVIKFELIGEGELDWNWCNKGATSHHWYVYECKVSGDVKINKKEVKSFGWFSPKEIENLMLEPSWSYWFKKLKVI